MQLHFEMKLKCKKRIRTYSENIIYSLIDITDIKMSKGSIDVYLFGKLISILLKF